MQAEQAQRKILRWVEGHADCATVSKCLSRNFDGTWEDRSPGIEGEDVGGKENDRNIVSTDSDYDRAKAFYFARGKKTAKNKAAEGVDYLLLLSLWAIRWCNGQD